MQFETVINMRTIQFMSNKARRNGKNFDERKNQWRKM